MFKRQADEALHNNKEKKITPYSSQYHRRKGSCGVQKKKCKPHHVAQLFNESFGYHLGHKSGAQMFSIW